MEEKSQYDPTEMPRDLVGFFELLKRRSTPEGLKRLTEAKKINFTALHFGAGMDLRNTIRMNPHLTTYFEDRNMYDPEFYWQQVLGLFVDWLKGKDTWREIHEQKIEVIEKENSRTVRHFFDNGFPSYEREVFISGPLVRIENQYYPNGKLKSTWLMDKYASGLFKTYDEQGEYVDQKYVTDYYQLSREDYLYFFPESILPQHEEPGGVLPGIKTKEEFFPYLFSNPEAE